MKLNEYQELAARTMATRGPDFNMRDGLALCGLGLAGESGEVVELLKKHLFHGHQLDKEKVTKELGDVLWYLSQCARILDVTLEEVARKNIEKLAARYPAGFTEKDSIERVAEE